MNYEYLVASINYMGKNRKKTISKMEAIAKEINRRRCSFIKNIAILISWGVSIITMVLLFVIGDYREGLLPYRIVTAVALITALCVDAMEMVQQKVDLEEVQRIVIIDKDQCNKVYRLWNEFERYNNVIRGICLATPSERSDKTSVRTWVKVIVFKLESLVIALDFLMPKMERLLDLNMKVAENYEFNPSTVPSLIASYGVPILIVVCGVIKIMTSLQCLYEASSDPAASDLKMKAKQLKDVLREWYTLFSVQPMTKQKSLKLFGYK